MTLKTRTIRRLLLTAGFGCLAIAWVLFIWVPSLRMMGLAALLASLGFIQAAKRTGSAALPTSVVLDQSAPKPVRWSIGAVLFGLVVATYVLLQYASRHDLWRPVPLYLFAAAALAAAWWFVGLLTRWLR
jgi:chromate transport protein ChrA